MSPIFDLLPLLTWVEAHGAARHVDGELGAALHGVGQRQEGEEDVGPVRGVQTQLQDAGRGRRHDVLNIRAANEISQYYGLLLVDSAY